MPTLIVAIPFTVNMGPENKDGTPRDPALPNSYVFPTPGKYDVPDDVAQHPYVPPHLEGYVPPVEGETVVMVPEPEEPPPGETIEGAARGRQQRQSPPE